MISLIDLNCALAEDMDGNLICKNFELSMARSLMNMNMEIFNLVGKY